VDECISKAMNDMEDNIIISDSGDNPTAGGGNIYAI
jgi:microcystin degradation protein MlrC